MAERNSVGFYINHKTVPYQSYSIFMKWFSFFLAFVMLGCHQSNTPKTFGKNKINLPEGFEIDVFADNIENARSLCQTPNGTVFIGTKKAGKVYALRDENGDGRAEKKWVIAKDMNTPNGVTFKDGALYVAEIDKIWRFDNIETQLEKPPKPVLVTDDLPSEEHHGWKFIAFGPEGKLYVPVGAPCNVCNEENPLFSTILRMNADGTNREIYAHGVRNSVGFSWHPITRHLWFTDNGRDMLGDDLPPDELNHAPQAGSHFGFPYCHGGDINDPEFGKEQPCGPTFTKPAKKLGPHVAALGMRFYTGTMFPETYKNQIFIAEHGSWNRSKKTGYRVSLIRLDQKGEVESYQPFAEGWLKGEEVSGRPVDVLVWTDGSLLVSDDFADKVYRITWKG